MSREPQDSDFHVDVDGVGHFVFAHRTVRDEIRISAEFSRLTEGCETPTSYLENMAGWISVLKVLTVEAPHGWEPERMDPLDEDTHPKIVKVFRALRAKEVEFRKAKNPAGQAERTGAGQ